MLLATVNSNVNLHLQGCKGYKHTATTVAFDGSEDKEIGGDARQFWDEMDMRARIDKELKRLKKRHDDKELIWSFENVQKEVIPYPKHGKYDAEPEGMEDEAVESVVAEHERLWEEDSDAEERAAAAEIGSDEEPDPFDARDWVNPEEAREKYASSEEDLRCRGDIADHTNSQLSLPNAQNTFLLDHQSRLRAYKECYDNLTSLRSPISYSLGKSVEQVMHIERKRLHQVSKCPAEVFARMDEMLKGDLNKRRKLQEEYQKAVSQAKEKHALQKKVSECKSNFNKLSAEMKRIEAVVAALTSQKAFSAEMLGQGRAKGGNKEHMLNRYEVLERVRRVGKLTEDQKGQWDFFKTQWDAAQASEIGKGWGLLFGEYMQDVLLKILHGDSDAFSKFVKSETDRVLKGNGVLALVAPGFPTSTIN